jgi:MoaA/NifB/PqqE/SkfB family radical SAM enzyme
MKHTDIFRAWGMVLGGRKPLLSLEITRECPLHCPGCYAYEEEHLGSAGPLRLLRDFHGDDLVSGVMELIDLHRPLHVSIVGGEPLVRARELSVLLPKLDERGIEVQLVTSAVAPIPLAWRDLTNLHLAVSIDGLRPEHDVRRAPATYDRILKNIAGHSLIVHRTITHQQVQREGYFEEFARFWSDRDEVRKIWFSLFTPQHGQNAEERLTHADRVQIVRELTRLSGAFPKVDMHPMVLNGYLHPPTSPQECIFAQTTTCISADLSTRIEPCQFGGEPVCEECGCMASAGLASIGNYKLAGFIPVGGIYSLSRRIGQHFNGAS